MIKDISDEVELKNESSHFGWSQFEIWHKGKIIGWVENGIPMDFINNYSFKIIQKDSHTTHCFIFEDIE